MMKLTLHELTKSTESKCMSTYLVFLKTTSQQVHFGVKVELIALAVYQMALFYLCYFMYFHNKSIFFTKYFLLSVHNDFFSSVDSYYCGFESYQSPNFSCILFKNISALSYILCLVLKRVQNKHFWSWWDSNPHQ